MQNEEASGVTGYFVPELQHTFLPGCRNCGGSHPLARKIVPVRTDICPDCEQPVMEAGPTHIEEANIGGGPVGVIARACLSVGKALTNLSKRI